MVSVRSLALLAVAILVVVFVTAGPYLVHAGYSALQSPVVLVDQAGLPSNASMLPLTLNTTARVFVIGPSWFVRRISSHSGVFMVNASQFSSLPNGSVIIVDWNYVNDTLHVGFNGLARLLEGPIAKGDLIMVYVNSTSPSVKTMVEYTTAVAWGNAHHSKVIGFPVINTTTPAYVVAYGTSGLMVTVIPLSTYYSKAINMIMAQWAASTLKPRNYTAATDSTDQVINQDECAYLVNNYAGKLNGQYGWLFSTQGAYYDNQGDEYRYDYCILVLNYTSSSNVIFTDYYGYMNYVPSFMAGGSFVNYGAAINMSTAYQNVDEPSGYNSYMGWSEATSALQPGGVSCPIFSKQTLQLIIDILQQALEFTYEAASGSDGYTSKLTVTNPVPTPVIGCLNDVVWSFGVTNALCGGASLTNGSSYPVGFGLTNGQGEWYLAAGVNNINIAASPVFSSGGVVCKPTTGGSWQEYFGSSIYFVLEYNPGASWSVGQVSINYYGTGPYNFLLPVSASCPS